MSVNKLILGDNLEILKNIENETVDLSLANQTIVLERGDNRRTEDVLKEYPSVERIVWIDQSSSAGDWYGLIVEKAGNDQYNLLYFFQEIDYYIGGKTISIQESITKIPVTKEMIDDVVETYCEIISEDYNYEEEIASPTPDEIKKDNNIVQLELF